MQIDRYKIEKVFNEYVSNYDITNEKIKLKVDHTYRVSYLCEQIALSLRFKEDDVNIAYLIGMLHDIGRFEQVKRYGTFNDSKSISHAELGIQILFEEGKLREFIDDTSEDELIRNTIANHSMYELPNNLDNRTLRFCNLLRDADKIDIFKVNIIIPFEKIYDVPLEEIYNSTISTEVMNNLKDNKTVLRKLKKTAVDNVVGHISLIFGLIYDESIKITLKQGYLQKLMEFKSENHVTKEQFKEICKIVNLYIEKRINKIK